MAQRAKALGASRLADSNVPYTIHLTLKGRAESIGHSM